VKVLRGMEAELLPNWHRLSRDNQLMILGAIEGKLDSQAEDAAKVGYGQRKRPVDVSAPSRPHVKLILIKSIP
jgi:hypothetical protein